MFFLVFFAISMCIYEAGCLGEYLETKGKHRRPLT